MILALYAKLRVTTVFYFLALPRPRGDFLAPAAGGLLFAARPRPLLNMGSSSSSSFSLLFLVDLPLNISSNLPIKSVKKNFNYSVLALILPSLFRIISGLILIVSIICFVRIIFVIIPLSCRVLIVDQCNVVIGSFHSLFIFSPRQTLSFIALLFVFCLKKKLWVSFLE